MRAYLELFLVALGVIAAWCAWVYISPFTDCHWCKGTGRHKWSGKRFYGACWNPRCRRGTVQRAGSKSVHRAVRAVVSYHRREK